MQPTEMADSDMADVADVLVPVAEGVRLHVRHRAGPRGPTFVLVHGLSSNARLWDGVASRLAEAGHPVYAVDLRSHGESDSPPSGYDTATAAADLAELCRRLGLRPAVVVGQSWGGNVAVRLAAQHPALVCGLGLVDGGWLDLTLGFDTWAECYAALCPPDIDGLPADDLRERLRREHIDWADDAVAATLFNLRITPSGTVQRRLPVDRHMDIVRSMWEDPPWPDLAKITVPTLLLPAVPRDPERGERQRAGLERAVAALARVRVREYPGADHDLHAQQPDALAADLLTLGAEC